MSLVKQIVNKLLSARYIITIVTTTTFSILAYHCTKFVGGLEVVDKKEIVMLVLGAFIAIVQGIIIFYFQRSDRASADNGAAEAK